LWKPLPLRVTRLRSMHYERAARVWNARAGGSSRKISERMALYLEGKTPLSANDLSPKEATE
jgi:hypothetical protein